MRNVVFATFLLVCSSSSFGSADELPKSASNKSSLKRTRTDSQPADQEEGTACNQRLEARRQAAAQESLQAADRLARAAAERLAMKQRAALSITADLQTNFMKCLRDKSIRTKDVKNLIATLLKEQVPEEHFNYYYAIATNRRKPELTKKSVEWLHEYITVMRPIGSAIYNKYFFRQRWPTLNLDSDPLPQSDEPPMRPAFDHWRNRT